MASTPRTRAEAETALRALPGGDRALSAVAATTGAWVVGGAVRDALLGRVPGELDVVVEGELAPLLDRLGGEIAHVHDRFGTATATLPEGLRVDLVRARRERYAAPGALPEVAPADLAADLARRDVTVNAIALRPGEELRAVDGALADLAAGLLRVLHPASFVDDPTRAWRIARYATRLGFTVEPETVAGARAADAAAVSGPRHGAELRRTLRERDPVAALTATQTLAPQLLPATLFPRDVGDAVALLPGGEGDAGLIALARACEPVDATELVAWLDALAFTGAERSIVAAGSRASTFEPLRRADGPVAIGRAARGVAVELIALAGGQNARRWLAELRHVQPAVDGHDLVAAGITPGPELGARLQAVQDAVLDDPTLSAERQLAVAVGWRPVRDPDRSEGGPPA